MCKHDHYYLITSDLLEGGLKYFKVLNVFMFEVGAELDFLQLNAAGEEQVQKVAVCRA